MKTVDDTSWERLYHLVDTHKPLSFVVAFIIFMVLLQVLNDSRERKNNRKN